jgi:hypothetical protein
MMETAPFTLMERTTDATVAMELRVPAQVNCNHSRVHASPKSSRGPRVKRNIFAEARVFSVPDAIDTTEHRNGNSQIFEIHVLPLQPDQSPEEGR